MVTDETIIKLMQQEGNPNEWQIAETYKCSDTLTRQKMWRKYSYIFRHYEQLASQEVVT